MATTFVIACPECGKQVKVSDEHVGKKIRCKGCEHIYPVAAPGGPPPVPKGPAGPPPVKPKAGPPPVKPKVASPSPPALPPPTPVVDAEDDGKAYIVEQEDNSMPRCPFCAKEMASAEAMICLNCGYNTRTRTRPEVKAVYEPTSVEVFLWLLPGFLYVLTVVGFIVWYYFFWDLIEQWLKKSFLEESDGVFTGGLSPKMFRLYMAIILIFASYPILRIAFKRLFKNNKPPERKIKDN